MKSESKAKAVSEQAQKIWLVIVTIIFIAAAGTKTMISFGSDMCDRCKDLQQAEDELRVHKRRHAELLRYKGELKWYICHYMLLLWAFP